MFYNNEKYKFSPVQIRDFCKILTKNADFYRLTRVRKKCTLPHVFRRISHISRFWPVWDLPRSYRRRSCALLEVFTSFNPSCGHPHTPTSRHSGKNEISEQCSIDAEPSTCLIWPRSPGSQVPSVRRNALPPTRGAAKFPSARLRRAHTFCLNKTCHTKRNPLDPPPQHWCQDISDSRKARV